MDLTKLGKFVTTGVGLSFDVVATGTGDTATISVEYGWWNDNILAYRYSVKPTKLMGIEREFESYIRHSPADVRLASSIAMLVEEFGAWCAALRGITPVDIATELLQAGVTLGEFEIRWSAKSAE